MDYEQFIKKSVQFNTHIYCFTKKEFLSFGLDYQNTIHSTDFLYNTNIWQTEQGSKLKSKFHVTALNDKFPKASLWIFSDRCASLHISDTFYRININSNHPSITLNLSPDSLLNYQVSASFISAPSVIGSINFKNLLMSIHFFDQKISLAYQIKGSMLDINCGFKMKNTNSIFDTFYDSFTGIRIPFSQDQSFSFASGFVSDSYKISCAYQNMFNRVTYVYINTPIFNGTDYSYPNFNLLQYKYIMKNRNKIAFLYPLLSKTLYLRGSINILDILKVKMTAKIDNTEGTLQFKPSFGFLLNLNQIAYCWKK